ncbi:aldehyde dehydrogenase family protein [Streptomyces sp. MS1.AVA.1]|uniref:Aldehyde dehydrogenase family protein n=1 Tax=Streptomyces machairae TaxID=3134109 RepID=A0ABU8UFN6_9ACTN
MYAGESNGKQVAVEAGGKSPQLVLADADIEAAASAVAWGSSTTRGRPATRAPVSWSTRR